MKTETNEKTVGHTPGPWSVPHFACEKSDVKCDCKYVLCDDYMGAICTVHVADEKNEGDDPPLDEAIANARLIASSPELLEALKAVRDEMRTISPQAFDEFSEETKGKLLSAIAKAEGTK